MSKLFTYVFVIFVMTRFGESKKSYILKDNSWNNEIKKCASGGEDHHSYDFTIGNLTAIGLDYNDIDALTTVLAFGTFNGNTNAVQKSASWLLLHDYSTNKGFKKFAVYWGYEAVCGWGKQSASVTLTVKFLESGQVLLNNYVYAASWGAVTCAYSVSYVKSVQIVN